MIHAPKKSPCAVTSSDHFSRINAKLRSLAAARDWSESRILRGNDAKWQQAKVRVNRIPIRFIEAQRWTNGRTVFTCEG